MSAGPLSLAVVIPTYRREQVLVETVKAVLALEQPADEVLVIDETEEHEPGTLQFLKQAEASGRLRWRRHRRPGQVSKLNRGLLEARSDIVLFLDDDVVPGPELVAAHRRAYAQHPEAWGVVGQVRQPGQEPPVADPARSGATTALRRDLEFPFHGNTPAWVENVITCNLSVRRDRALAVGGFDENFVPPVAHRAETEFAKRLLAAGGRIRFEPAAAVRHLRAARGGTRAAGGHLTSAAPAHGVGDYYYALRVGTGWDRLCYMARRPFREVRTKFHLRHPWWIPVKFIGELRAIRLALRLYREGPRLLPAAAGSRRIILLATEPPDRPNGSMVRYAGMVRDALRQHAATPFIVETLHLSPSQAWLDRWPRPVREPLRYACIARQARRILPRQRAGLLHLLDGSHAYLLGGVRARHVPLAITVHDFIPALCLRGELAGPRPGIAAAWVIRQALANLCRADALAADSMRSLEDAVRIAGIGAGRGRVVHPAIMALEPGPAGPPPLSVPYILHVAGNHSFYKNGAGVIAVFAAIRRHEPVRLVMIGPPPGAALQRQIKAADLQEVVEFHTCASDAELAAWYRGAACLLFPSLYEGFGWPPLEAMACGCPVVCSNAGSLAEIAGPAALQAPPDDIPALAELCLRLLHDAGERRRRIEAGLLHARRFNLATMAAGLVEVYDRAEEVFRTCAMADRSHAARPYRLAIVETHPIQYKAPLFRRLAAHPRLDPVVLYAMIPDADQQGAGFDVPFAWDVPLLEGYRHEVLENRARSPSPVRFGGCDTPGLPAWLKRNRPDAVLVNGWVAKTCLQALWACRRLGIPCMVRGEANLLRPRPAWKHALHRLLLRQYAAYLAIGSANRDFYRYHHCPDGRIFSAPYAVDNAYFAAQAAARVARREEIRAAFGIFPGRMVFLFAGKLEPKKRPQDVLHALARLPPDQRERACLLVAGAGPLRAECERLAQELGLAVVFAGFLNQSRLPDAYAAADLLVLPSDAGETWGLVVNEAMASGRPAVVSRAAGCCRDLVVEGVTGYTFEAGDVPGLAALLAGYLADPAQAVRQGEAAARQIQSFSLERTADGLLAALDACVPESGNAGGAVP